MKHKVIPYSFCPIHCYQPPFYSHYGGLVGAEFDCPDALADGSQSIRITEKMLEFSSTVLSTLSPYLTASSINKQ